MLEKSRDGQQDDGDRGGDQEVLEFVRRPITRHGARFYFASDATGFIMPRLAIRQGTQSDIRGGDWEGSATLARSSREAQVGKKYDKRGGPTSIQQSEVREHLWQSPPPAFAVAFENSH